MCMRMHMYVCMYVYSMYTCSRVSDDEFEWLSQLRYINAERMAESLAEIHPVLLFFSLELLLRILIS